MCDRGAGEAPRGLQSLPAELTGWPGEPAPRGRHGHGDAGRGMGPARWARRTQRPGRRLPRLRQIHAQTALRSGDSPGTAAAAMFLRGVAPRFPFPSAPAARPRAHAHVHMHHVARGSAGAETPAGIGSRNEILLSVFLFFIDFIENRTRNGPSQKTALKTVKNI